MNIIIVTFFWLLSQYNVFIIFAINVILTLYNNNQTYVEVHKKFFEEQKLHFCLGHHFLLASGTQPRKFINQIISTQNIQTGKIQYDKS